MNALVITKNRKAMYDHELLERFSAGIVLKGYEVKAIKENQANLEGSYVQIVDGVPCVVNMYIGRYSGQSKDFDEFNARRNRTLLLNKKEIAEIERETSEKGKTAIPLAIVLQNNKLKVEFAIVRGKKEFEKKQVAKDRQVKRDLEREAKELRT
jgi:SsrA-binding protein